MSKHAAIYVRVSSKAQEHKSQLPELERWAEAQDGPVKWYFDKFTGKTMNRPGWKKLEVELRAGRISKLVCWKLDRLGRIARELLSLFEELRQRNVDFVCVTSGVMSLKTIEGRMFLGVLAQFAEYDNELRSERIRAGQSVARSEGKTWGGSQAGKRKKVTPLQERTIHRMKRDREPVTAIAQAVGLSRPTVYDVLKGV